MRDRLTICGSALDAAAGPAAGATMLVSGFGSVTLVDQTRKAAS